MRFALLALLFTLPLVAAAEIPKPAATKGDEPTAKSFSAEKAGDYLDGVGINWTRDRQCMTCHTNMAQVMAGPALVVVAGCNSPDMAKLPSFSAAPPGLGRWIMYLSTVAMERSWPSRRSSS